MTTQKRNKKNNTKKAAQGKRQKNREYYIIFGLSLLAVLAFVLLATHQQNRQQPNHNPSLTYYSKDNPPSQEQVKWVEKEIVATGINENATILPVITKALQEIDEMSQKGKLHFELYAGIGKITKEHGGLVQTALTDRNEYVIRWSAAQILNILRATSTDVVKKCVVIGLYHELLHIKLGHVRYGEPKQTDPETKLKRLKEESLVHYLVIKNVFRPLLSKGDDLLPYFPLEQELDKALMERGDNPYHAEVMKILVTGVYSDLK